MLIAVALIFPVSAAQSMKGSDPIVCIPDGPVPGCIAEDIPQPEADEMMAEMGADMSEGANNITEPGHANQFAFESDEPNASGEHTRVNLNLDTLQGNGKIDVPTGAKPALMWIVVCYDEILIVTERVGRWC
jgi:hypothetical protein